MPPNFANLTPAPLITGGPGGTARATGLPQFPGTTLISSLGSGRPIQFILNSRAAQVLPNLAARQSQGLDDPTISQYKFSGSKLSGLKGDDVITFYQAQATAAGYKLEGITPLQDTTANRMRWLYLSKGAERVGILVVDSNDTETGSTFGLTVNETGIYFATT